MEYKGHFTVSRKDNIDFNFLLMKKRLISSTIIVFIIIVILVTLLNYALKAMPLASALLQGLLMGALGIVLMLAINIGSMYTRLSAMYKQNKIQDFTYDVTVNKTGFHATSNRGDSDIPWERVQSMRETKRAFYVFITENNANVMPKSQMRLPADAELIRSLAVKNLDASRCKLKKA